jgi:hypothetical protein
LHVASVRLSTGKNGNANAHARDLRQPFKVRAGARQTVFWGAGIRFAMNFRTTYLNAVHTITPSSANPNTRIPTSTMAGKSRN